jgi:hypothetical protein
MPKQPAYFDSQASAAAALEMDICELRDAKRQGCPAFRSGRVYGDELRRWLQAEQLRKIGSAASNGVGIKNARAAVAQTIRGISQCADLGILTAEQRFDFCITIVDAAGDPHIRDVFTETIYDWLQRNFQRSLLPGLEMLTPKSWPGLIRRPYGGVLVTVSPQLKLSRNCFTSAHKIRPTILNLRGRVNGLRKVINICRIRCVDF